MAIDVKVPDLPPTFVKPPAIIGRLNDWSMDERTTFTLDGENVAMRDVMQEGIELNNVVVIKGRVVRLEFKRSDRNRD